MYLNECCYNIGADVNITNDEDKTPLMIASRLGYIDIVKLLLLYKACINHHSNYEGYDALLELIGSTTTSSIDKSSKDGFNTFTGRSSNSNHQNSNDIENKISSFESCQNKIKLIKLLINSGKNLYREYFIYLFIMYILYIFIFYTFIYIYIYTYFK